MVYVRYYGYLDKAYYFNCYSNLQTMLNFNA